MSGRGNRANQIMVKSRTSPKELGIKKTISFDTLYHVGTLNAADKGLRFKGSYEGSGLSVSLDPARWIQIAKLGGFPTWKMTRDTEATFVNRHELDESDIENIKTWAAEKHYFVEKDCWMVTWDDDELESEMCISLNSLEEAREENPYNTDENITKGTRLIATEELLERSAIYSRTDCTDGLIIAWAEDHGYAGVWWEDEDGAYSCARGTIFASHVSDWKPKQIR